MISTNVVSTRWAASLVSVMGILIAVGCTSALPGGSKFQKYNETQLRDAIAGRGAPSWVGGEVPSIPGQRFFIGRGGGYNVLDERAAVDEAMDHARSQLARYVGTQVAVESCTADWSDGVRFLPISGGPGGGESVDQFLRSRSHVLAENVVGELYKIDEYWEQWQVDEDPDRVWDTPGLTVEDLTGAVVGGAIGAQNTGTSRGATTAIGAALGLYAQDPDDFQMRRYKCWVLTSVSDETIEMYVGAALATLEREVELFALEEKLAEFEDELAAKDATLLAARKDVEKAQEILNERLQELQLLRERVHYGRRFRLIAEDDYLSYRAPVAYLHPEWRDAEVFTRTEVETRVETKVVDHEHDHDRFCEGIDGGCLLDH